MVFLFHYFPLSLTLIFASILLSPSQLNFCVNRNSEFTTTFLYHVISEILLVRKTNTVLGLVKVAHICSIFEASRIPLIHLPVKDETSYACSCLVFFFLGEQGNWLTVSSVMPHPGSSLVISLRRCCQSVHSSQSHY